VVAQPHRAGGVAAGQQRRDLPWLQATRQRVQPPARHGWDRRGQRHRDQPLDMQEPQQGTHRGHQRLRRPDAVGLGAVPDHERGDRHGIQPRQRRAELVAELREERLGLVGVAAHRLSGQPTLPNQPGAIVGQQRLHRRGVRRQLRSGNHTPPAQQPQHRRQPSPGHRRHPAVLAPHGHKLLHPGRRQPTWRQTRGVQPAAQARHRPHGISNRRRRIARLRQVRTQPSLVRRQRTRHHATNRIRPFHALLPSGGRRTFQTGKSADQPMMTPVMPTNARRPARPPAPHRPRSA
jgi:hypothetical protein